MVTLPDIFDLQVTSFGAILKMMNTPSINNQQNDFIMNQINKLYCAQSHLFERFSEIIDHHDFTDLRADMLSTIHDMEQQITNTNELYAAYQCEYSFELCNTMFLSLEEDFNQVQQHSGNSLRDMNLLNYVQNIQNIISSTFQLIQLSAHNLDTRFGSIIRRNYQNMVDAQPFKLLLISNIQAAGATEEK
jgi:hypothetical protein